MTKIISGIGRICGDAEMPKQVMWDFDEVADVLYMSIGKPDPRARSRSDENGFVWRTSKDGVRRGVTIQNARAWAKRKAELEALLAEGFQLKREQVRAPELV